MNKVSSLILSCVLLYSSVTVSAQKKYHVAVIGSSTATGMGANDPIEVNGWVGQIQQYWESLGLLDSAIFNIARSGLTTWDDMPAGFVPPNPDNGHTRDYPIAAYNVTTALNDNPDVVLVNLPSNDVSDTTTLAETMSNFRTIYQAVVKAGKVCYITTTQPKCYDDTNFNRILMNERDSILMEFPGHSINFYNCICDPTDSFNFAPQYYYDCTHTDQAGHDQLFEQVKAANILPLPSPLPLTLLSFTANHATDGNHVDWTIAGLDGPVTFEVQRSSNGTAFEDQWRQNEPAAGTDTHYSWTDQAPEAGKNYYRLKYTEMDGEHYSPVVVLDNGEGSWAVKVISYAGGSEATVQIQTRVSQNCLLIVTDAMGAKLFSRQVNVPAPSGMIQIPMSGWANGEYFIRVVSDQDNATSKAFLKF